MKKVIVSLVVLVILVGAIVLVVSKRHKDNTDTTTNTPATSQTTPASSSTTTPAAKNVITYDGSGFSPSQLTVKSGDTVTVKNSSSDAVQFQSDPHPTHTDDPDLNVGMIQAGQSATFTATKKGSFGYHNHLDPSQRGNITIE